MFLNQIRKNKKEGPSSSTRESDDLPMLSETYDVVKVKRERRLCNGKPRKGELLRTMDAATHRVVPR